MKHIVAIVGRPNVGKSTMFNRILGRRDAIVEAVSGVTRDRHYGEADWAGKEFSLVDTGGFVPDTSDVFELAIREQAQIAIEEAEVIVFVVDARDGIVPVDNEIAEMLRRSSKQVVLLVNKCDNEKADADSVMFWALGLGEPFPVSAMNGRRIGDALDAITNSFAPSDTDDDGEQGPLKIALIGRPNVGKSSITNALLGQDRAIVTPIAGTTRDSIDSTVRYYGEEIILIDTAGLRKRKQVHDSIELYSIIRTVRAIERCDVAIVVIDAEQGLERQDARIIGEAAEKRKGIIIAVNKWDLVEKDTMTAKRFEDAIRSELPTFDYIPVVFISAVTRQRVTKLIELAKHVNEERHKRIGTSRLNDIVLEAIKNHPPPSVKGHDLRINFIQQPQAAPPVFLCYTNFPELMPDNYTRYLERVIRREFSFEGVPLTLVFKQKNKMRQEA
ncbi:MAG TPA: ribosome biogenesis GTPase Der [Candidatus Kapabacteria bacterium]|nr:ribosome biogenesis GTPase Der [Candidatus Kapabacteria bacterium]